MAVSGPTGQESVSGQISTLRQSRRHAGYSPRAPPPVDRDDDAGDGGDVLLAGDDRKAKDDVAALIARIPGLRPIDCGDLEIARIIARRRPVGSGQAGHYDGRSVRL